MTKPKYQLKVIIAGGRHFANYDMLIEKCDYYLNNYEKILIISGGATGADAMAIRYSITNY